MTAGPFIRVLSAAIGLLLLGSDGHAAEIDVFLDLLNAGGSETTLNAPPGQFFFFRLRNRALGATYRVTADWVLAPDSPKPPDRALHQTYELAQPVPSAFRSIPRKPPCDDLQQATLELLLLRDEADVASRVDALEPRLAGVSASCPDLLARLDHTRPRLSIQYSLRAADRLAVTIDKLDPISRAVVRTWRAVVRSGIPERHWTYENEEAWVKGQISLDIAEQVLFGRGGRTVDPGALAFQLSGDAPSGTYRVRLKVDTGAFESSLGRGDHLWSPAAFEALAASLLKRVGLNPRHGSADAPALQALLTPSAAVIRAESRRVSERLREHWADPDAHVEAAIVVGSLALREPAGEFADLRPALNRMSAHLALSRALRGAKPAPRSAELAEALLETLVGRERPALDRIARLEGTHPSPPEQAWLRALKMRNSGDWRVLQRPEQASLLERLVYYRALLERVDADHALEFAGRSEQGSLPDWGWLAMARLSGVEVGNRYAESTARLTQQELAETGRQVRGGDWAATRVAEALNEAPGRAIRRPAAGGPPALQVIDWGLWGQFYQRQLCLLAVKTDVHLREVLASPDDAARYRVQAADRLGGLQLFGVVSQRWAVAQAIESAHQQQRRPLATQAQRPSEDSARGGDPCGAIARLTQRTPELVTFSNWEFLSGRCPRERSTGEIAPPREWFTRGVPFGTTYDAEFRLPAAGTVLKGLAPEAESLRRIAPFARPAVEYYLAQKYGSTATLLELQEAFGPLGDYDVGALKAMAERAGTDAQAFQRYYEKIASLTPNAWLDLASYLAQRDLDAEAAAAYEKAVALAPNRVAVSQEMDWFVDVLFDRGETERALSVARMAAEVYTSGGLMTQARLMERLGRYEEAEGGYKRTAERYGDPGPLLSFYLRYQQRHQDRRFAADAEKALHALFPGGLEKTSPNRLPPPGPSPDQCLVISPFDMTEKLRRLGVRSGDRVVALDGYRVRDLQQYLAVRSFRDEPRLSLVVWRGDRYEEVIGAFRRYRYGPRR